MCQPCTLNSPCYCVLMERKDHLRLDPAIAAPIKAARPTPTAAAAPPATAMPIIPSIE